MYLVRFAICSSVGASCKNLTITSMTLYGDWKMSGCPVFRCFPWSHTALIQSFNIAYRPSGARLVLSASFVRFLASNGLRYSPLPALRPRCHQKLLPKLCIELDTSIIDKPTGIELETKGYAKGGKGKFEQQRICLYRPTSAQLVKDVT